jgi:MFS transporter, DHA1 family, tetracycline resistance protein
MPEENSGAPVVALGPRRATVAFIFVTVLLDMLSLGMILPVLPKLVENFMGGDTARAAEIFGIFGTAWALMQFLFSPVIGALSDAYGRRPVVLIANLGLGLDYILMALAPNLWWLFVGRVISGITAANVSTGFAYITDVTAPENRAKNFGMIGAAFGLGFVLGPALGGVFGAIDPRLPFWIAAGLSLANALYGVFVLPESLPPERRMPFALKRANPVGSLVLLRSHPELTGLAGSEFLGDLAHAVLPSVFVLYAGYRYNWNEQMVGLTLAVVGVCSLIVQVGLVGPIVGRLGERRALALALFSGIAGFIVFGFATVGPVFWIGIPIMSLWGLADPAVNGLMSRRVSASEQGQLQGAKSSIMGIASMAGPGVFTLTFAYSIGAGSVWQLPGAPFLLAAIFLGASMALAWYATRTR